jgi:hypothetical protein
MGVVLVPDCSDLRRGSNLELAAFCKKFFETSKIQEKDLQASVRLPRF